MQYVTVIPNGSTKRIPQVPTHAAHDNVIGKVSPAERCWSGSAHRITLPKALEPVCKTSRNSGIGHTQVQGGCDLLAGPVDKLLGTPTPAKVANSQDPDTKQAVS